MVSIADCRLVIANFCTVYVLTTGNLKLEISNVLEVT